MSKLPHLAYERSVSAVGAVCDRPLSRKFENVGVIDRPYSWSGGELRINGLPAVARVVFRYFDRAVYGLFSQILLVDDAVSTDQKRHHSRIPVLCRECQNSEATRHVSVHDIVFHTAVRVRLFREYPEVVPVERLRFRACFRVARTFRKVSHPAKRALVLTTLGGGPVQTVVRPFIADKLLRVLFYFIAGLVKVLLLSVGNGAERGDCSQFILSDASRKDLVRTRFSVEIPPAG